MLPLLELLTYSESSPVDDDPMRDWVNIVNRGGLTRITNEGVFMILNFILDVFSRWITQGI